MGRLHFYRCFQERKSFAPDDIISADDIPTEISKLDIATEEVRQKLESLYPETADLASEFLDELSERARDGIFKGKNVLSSVNNAFDSFFHELAAGGDPYITLKSTACARAADQLMRELSSDASSKDRFPFSPMILCAEGITKKELEAIDPSMLLGLLLPDASPLSETALYAHSFGIPLIVGCDEPPTFNGNEGKNAIIDAQKGILLTKPEEEDIERYVLRLGELSAKRTSEKNCIRRWAFIRSERDLAVFSSEGFSPCACVLDIESFFQGKLPDRERLFSFFRSVSDAAEGKEIRILISVSVEDMQGLVSAAISASEFGEISIVLGEIYNEESVERIKGILAASENESSARVKVGAMIENGAAAILCQRIIRTADFLVINCDSLFLSLVHPKESAHISPDFVKSNLGALHEAVRVICEESKKAEKDVCLCGMLTVWRASSEKLFPVGADRIALPPCFLI